MPKLILFIEICHRVQETGMASDVGRFGKVTYVRMMVMTYSYTHYVVYVSFKEEENRKRQE